MTGPPDALPTPETADDLKERVGVDGGGGVDYISSTNWAFRRPSGSLVAVNYIEPQTPWMPSGAFACERLRWGLFLATQSFMRSADSQPWRLPTR